MLGDAMERLFEAGQIKVLTEGPPSHPRTRLAEASAVPSTASTDQKHRQTENKFDAGSQEASCAATTGISTPCTDPSTDLPPPSTGVCVPPSRNLPPAGTGKGAVEAPARSNGGGPTVASVPFMITRAMREQLRQCGVSDDQIAELTPQQAHDIIRGGLPPADYRGEREH